MNSRDKPQRPTPSAPTFAGIVPEGNSRMDESLKNATRYLESRAILIGEAIERAYTITQEPTGDLYQDFLLRARRQIEEMGLIVEYKTSRGNRIYLVDFRKMISYPQFRAGVIRNSIEARVVLDGKRVEYIIAELAER